MMNKKFEIPIPTSPSYQEDKCDSSNTNDNEKSKYESDKIDLRATMSNYPTIMEIKSEEYSSPSLQKISSIMMNLQDLSQTSSVFSVQNTNTSSLGKLIHEKNYKEFECEYKYALNEISLLKMQLVKSEDRVAGLLEDLASVNENLINEQTENSDSDLQKEFSNKYDLSEDEIAILIKVDQPEKPRSSAETMISSIKDSEFEAQYERKEIVSNENQQNDELDLLKSIIYSTLERNNISKLLKDNLEQKLAGSNGLVRTFIEILEVFENENGTLWKVIKNHGLEDSIREESSEYNLKEKNSSSEICIEHYKKIHDEWYKIVKEHENCPNKMNEYQKEIENLSTELTKVYKILKNDSRFPIIDEFKELERVDGQSGTFSAVQHIKKSFHKNQSICSKDSLESRDSFINEKEISIKEEKLEYDENIHTDSLNIKTDKEIEQLKNENEQLKQEIIKIKNEQEKNCHEIGKLSLKLKNLYFAGKQFLNTFKEKLLQQNTKVKLLKNFNEKLNESVVELHHDLELTRKSFKLLKDSLSKKPNEESTLKEKSYLNLELQKQGSEKSIYSFSSNEDFSHDYLEESTDYSQKVFSEDCINKKASEYQLIINELKLDNFKIEQEKNNLLQELDMTKQELSIKDLKLLQFESKYKFELESIQESFKKDKDLLIKDSHKILEENERIFKEKIKMLKNELAKSTEEKLRIQNDLIVKESHHAVISKKTSTDKREMIEKSTFIEDEIIPGELFKVAIDIFRATKISFEVFRNILQADNKNQTWIKDFDSYQYILADKTNLLKVEIGEMKIVLHACLQFIKALTQMEVNKESRSTKLLKKEIYEKYFGSQWKLNYQETKNSYNHSKHNCAKIRKAFLKTLCQIANYLKNHKCKEQKNLIQALTSLIKLKESMSDMYKQTRQNGILRHELHSIKCWGLIGKHVNKIILENKHLKIQNASNQETSNIMNIDRMGQIEDRKHNSDKLFKLNNPYRLILSSIICFLGISYMLLNM